MKKQLSISDLVATCAKFLYLGLTAAGFLVLAIVSTNWIIAQITANGKTEALHQLGEGFGIGLGLIFVVGSAYLGYQTKKWPSGLTLGVVLGIGFIVFGVLVATGNTPL